MSGSRYNVTMQADPTSAQDVIGKAIHGIRSTLRWSQRELSRRSGVSQSMISAVERSLAGDLTFASASRLLEAMGARLTIGVDAPYLGSRRAQTDPAHARLSGSVARSLVGQGWKVATEVEVGGDRSRGWIDILAYHPATRMLLVIELKTEIHDLGAIDRNLGWYQREAVAAARRLGWRPSRIHGSLLLLATTVNDESVRFNRESLARIFPARVNELSGLVRSGVGANIPGRSMAMVDPRSRRRDWLRPTTVDGRRSKAPYTDYADFMRAIAASRRG